VTDGPTAATPHEGEDPRDVFLCHASADGAAAAALVARLESQGLRCWIAPRDVTPGSLYADSIVRAINATRVLVLLLSRDAVASPHVSKEIERASSKRHPIIALRMDATPLPPAFEYFLGESHWLDADAQAPASLAPQIAKAVDALCPGVADARPLGAGSPAVTATSSRARARLLPAAVAIAVAASGGALWYAMSPVRQASQAPAVAATAKSIAVLPFADMSEKKDQEYFGDGMAEEILDLLAKVPGLTVIGRTSSFQFKGGSRDLRAIGATLQAAHVLEGSVRTSADRLRITAQLVNAATGAREWSETYDRPIGDAIALQDTIAANVVRELQIAVGLAGLGPRGSRASAEAYDLLLRARHTADRREKDGLADAVLLLKQAAAMDPHFPDVQAELAYTYYRQGEGGFVLPQASFEQARAAANAALAMDPDNALAHFVLGSVHLNYDWDWVAAEREFQTLATLAPGNASALHGAALLAMTLGRWDDAVSKVKSALSRDPLEPRAWYTLGEILFRLGDWNESEAAARRALAIRPTFPWAHWLIGMNALSRGEAARAVTEFQQENTEDGRLIGSGMAYFALGRTRESDAALASLVQHHADGNAYGVGQVLAYRRRFDEADRWLERAYDQHDPFLIYVKAELQPVMPATDARFRALLGKMKLPE
jgi:TolB-like protein